MCVNKLILGDNLEIMKKMDSESVDLIYLDPPFFSNRNYEVIWGDKGEIRSFQDRWAGGIDHYIAWLKERVEEMYRILKRTGSIFLHCDWHANAYIRVIILDKIFGEDNFRNEIIWKRTNAKGLAFTRLPHNNDSIFYYTKSDIFTFNSQYVPHSEKYISDFYKYVEPETGRRYQLADLTNPNKDRPNLTYEFLGITRVWRWTKERMQEAYEKGLIEQSKAGTVPRLKRYLDEQEGTPIDDNWTDIINVQSTKEKIGYPTQKPESLLERIINMASKEGDTVFDPFVGGGTTVAVADRLGRKWIGVDQSVAAVKVTELRLGRQPLSLFTQPLPFTVQLHKYDYDTLRNKDAFEFEDWIIQQFGGMSNIKQRSDLGLDGKKDSVPIQVKRSDGIGRGVIDNFLSAIMRADRKLYNKNIKEKKPVGYIIAFSFGKGATQEIARLKLEEGIIIELVKVEDIVPISKKPRLTVEMSSSQKNQKDVWEIEFTATGESEAGIEFYSWDFAFDEGNGFRAEVMFDKSGAQKRTFKAGSHSVAVKVIDNDGLESIEVVKLKVNGAVEQIAS